MGTLAGSVRRRGAALWDAARPAVLADRALPAIAAHGPRLAAQSLRFCIDINSATLLRTRGAPLAKLEALEVWHDNNLFTARERSALAYAEAMTEQASSVDDALVAQLRPHFDDDAIVELTALIAFQNMSSKFNAALDIPPQGFCRTPSARRSSTDVALMAGHSIGGSD